MKSNGQPIETAPTDGTPVIITGYSHNTKEYGRWIEIACYRDGGWLQQNDYNDEDNEDDYLQHLYPPTHWQPTPDFPQD